MPALKDKAAQDKAHEEVRNYQKTLALLGKEFDPEARNLHAKPIYRTMFYGDQLSDTDEVIKKRHIECKWLPTDENLLEAICRYYFFAEQPFQQSTQMPPAAKLLPSAGQGS